MKNILTLILVVLTVAAFGQTEVKKEIKKEVKIENTEGKYKVTLVTTENGETKTVTKTYDSLDEMKNDPEMGDMKIMTLGGKGENIMVLKGEPGDDELEKEIKVVIEKGEGEEVHVDQDVKTDGNHTFVFKSDGGESSEMHKIKVWVDEDGKKHIMKNGVEIDVDGDANTWTDESGKTFEIKKSDGKVMFFSEGENGEFITEDGKHTKVKINVESGEGDGEKEIIIVETTSDAADADGERRIIVKIIEEVNIHLEEVGDNEFKQLPGIDAKALKLDDLNYYPNPNTGKFTLAFQADKKPLQIKITSVNGKEVYAEQLQSFEGTYNKEIDLGGQQPGIYLLQILQGKRVMNKKIVIE